MVIIIGDVYVDDVSNNFGSLMYWLMLECMCVDVRMVMFADGSFVDVF